MINAKVIEKSVSPAGKVITTFQLRYPRFIHAEAKTHRQLEQGVEEYQIVLTQDAGFMACTDLSRNASSSRAIPVRKMLDSIMAEPATPIHWGTNAPGMQAHTELEQPAKVQVQSLWNEACIAACEFADKMEKLGAHKQIVNRITEPFQHISSIVTATEWSNFYELRNHPDAQPEIQELARAMLEADEVAPIFFRLGSLEKASAWHLPYITLKERALYKTDSELLFPELEARGCSFSLTIDTTNEVLTS